jgi:hypothetical protein
MAKTIVQRILGANKRNKEKKPIIFAVKRSDGKVFSIGDKFTYKGEGTPIVLGKPSRKRMRISGFEANEKGSYYVLYFPTYSNGKVEKKEPWRACDLESAILIK